MVSFDLSKIRPEPEQDSWAENQPTAGLSSLNEYGNKYENEYENKYENEYDNRMRKSETELKEGEGLCAIYIGSTWHVLQHHRGWDAYRYVY